MEKAYNEIIEKIEAIKTIDDAANLNVLIYKKYLKNELTWNEKEDLYIKVYEEIRSKTVRAIIDKLAEEWQKIKRNSRKKWEDQK